jgi:hypothetical protein
MEKLVVRGSARQGTAGRGEAWPDGAGHGSARRGTVWHGNNNKKKGRNLSKEHCSIVAFLILGYLIDVNFCRNLFAAAELTTTKITCSDKQATLGLGYQQS